ncbi:hypothetical protein BKA67DRAFT_78247 [Truncatella angustata]|uniref:C2H2-type domain-containing protein n=1 Tax=Truncatella angustata TaxID=152316 RepID=A0A9P8V0F3_9PEZI|nr:uncharacterized protein BKA67DRAFT_78247 [Truncatella angustata]KAH6661199.1 hypothetical protein BKA67DRAFT_78247 [Truncatella angustata]
MSSPVTSLTRYSQALRLSFRSIPWQYDFVIEIITSAVLQLLTEYTMPRSQRTFNLPTLTLASQDAASHHSTSQTVPMPPSSLGQMIEERTPEPENGDSYPAPGMDHGRSKKRKTATELGLEVTRERKLACPYYKKDPTKHSTINACCGPGWDSISRLKEYLYRRHAFSSKLRCQRCFDVFDDMKTLQNHARAAQP